MEHYANKTRNITKTNTKNTATRSLQWLVKWNIEIIAGETKFERTVFVFLKELENWLADKSDWEHS